MRYGLSRDSEGVVQIEALSFLDAKEIAEKWLGITGIGFHSIGDTDTYHGSNLDRYYPHGVIGHATTDHMILEKEMSLKIFEDLVQGTPEWLAARRGDRHRLGSWPADHTIYGQAS